MKKLRAVFNTFVAASWTLTLSTVAIVSYPFIPSGAVARYLAVNAWGQLIFKLCGIKVRTHGLEKLDPNKTYFYLSNHMSLFDIVVLYYAFPHWVSMVAKKELVKVPLFGLAMKMGGTIVIDRTNRESAIRTLKEAGEKIREGWPVLMYPEGTRSKDFWIKEFKKGAFALACEAQVPVVPIVIEGTQNILPTKTILVYPADVDVYILDPIELDGTPPKTEEDAKKCREELRTKVHKIMTEFQKKIRQSK